MMPPTSYRKELLVVRGLGRACLCVSIYPVAVCRVFACLLFCGLERISCVISALGVR